MIKLNKNGFSLIELMIVTAGIAGVALIAMNVTKMTTKSSTKFQTDTDAVLITNEINAILSDPAKCKATFQANTLTPSNINGKFYTSASGQEPAAGYSNSGIKIQSYTLAASTDTGATANDGALTILFKNKKAVGVPTTPKRVNIYFEGPISAITMCRSVSTASVDIWSHGAGTDINYMGNVGIGTISPKAILDIETNNMPQIFVGDGNTFGNIFYTAWGPTLSMNSGSFWNGTIWQSTHTAASHIGLGPNGIAFQVSKNLTVGGSDPLNFAMKISPDGNVGVGTTTPATTLDISSTSIWRPLTVRGNGGSDIFVAGNSNGVVTIGGHNGAANAWANISINPGGGNVGIGTASPTAKLEVNGSIKPGAASTGGSCSPEGAFAYDFSTHAPVYCSNTGNWTAMGGSASAPIVAPVQVHGVNDGGAGFADNCPLGYSVTGINVSYNQMSLYCTKFN